MSYGFYMKISDSRSDNGTGQIGLDQLGEEKSAEVRNPIDRFSKYRREDPFAGTQRLLETSQTSEEAKAELKRYGSVMTTIVGVSASAGEKIDHLDSFSWDFVLVFAIGDEKIQMSSKRDGWKMNQKARFEITTGETIAKLRQAGLELAIYKSVKGDEVYCLVGASERRLRAEAARVDYDLELDTDEVIAQGQKLGLRLVQALASKSAEARLIDRSNWRPLFGKYKEEASNTALARLYKSRSSTEGQLHAETYFRSVDRLRLLETVMEADPLIGGAGISVANSKHNLKHSLRGFFPLHQNDKKDCFARRWLAWRPYFDQPLDEVRDYFGEKIAIYFAFVQFYSKWLILPALLGAAVFIAQIATDRVDLEAAPVFSILIALWGSVFLDYWKREEAECRARWGMTAFKEKEQPRPEFKGDRVRSPVDGRMIKHFPTTKKALRLIFSHTVVWTMISMVVAVVVGLFLFRQIVIRWQPKYGTYMIGVMNALQIQLLNFIYGKLSVTLTEYENHRTASEFENALIVKGFLFKFVNSYNSLFYIAFFKRFDKAVGGCSEGDCLSELQTQLGTIFVINIVVDNTIEWLLPAANRWWSGRGHHVYETLDGVKQVKVESAAEQQDELVPFESTVEDFSEMAIQFGYVCLFVVCFPLAPLLALINNYGEIRLDAKKLVQLCRRPLPEGANGIGMWSDIFQFISFLSVITNALLIVFDTNLIDNWTNDDLTTKIWTFVAAEHVILGLKLVLTAVIVDESAEIRDHMARQRFLVEVLINGVKEDRDDEEATVTKRSHGGVFRIDDVPHQLSPALAKFSSG